MRRREFLIGAAAAAGLAGTRRGWAQTPNRDPAKLARIAIMTLSFQPILKSANQEFADASRPAGSADPARTLDLMDIGQVYADKWGVHNVELQHTHLPSTEEAWLKDFKARLAKTKSQVSNINLEFGTMNISAPQWGQRVQAIDLTKQWIDHAVTLGCPRVMVNQGQPTQENKQVTIETLKAMGDYGKSKGIKVAMENRGGAPPANPTLVGRAGAAAAPAPPPTPEAQARLAAGQVYVGPPPHELLVEIIKGSGTHANCDMGNFPDQATQHAGIRMMLPLTDGNTHVKMNTQRYDLPAALKLAKELGYTGLFSIEANANLTANPASPNMGPDPYENVQKIYDVLMANI
jgi:sugar phosphate isomerase/epimerase